jgi:predicted  nucleic acid-binding Zn-ribbon protein
MIRDNHYQSLKRHITSFMTGLSQYGEDLPQEVALTFSEEYYQDALEQLEERKKKLEKRQKDYLKAVERFQTDYEQIRRTWKKDVMRLKRSMKKKPELLPRFGIGED